MEKYTMRAAVGGLGLAVALLGGCADECAPQATECRGAVLYICSSGGAWERHTDCAAILGGGSWRCCLERDGGDGCLPAEECADD